MNAQNGGSQQNNNDKQNGLSWSSAQKPAAAAPVAPVSTPAPKVVAPAAKVAAPTTPSTTGGNAAKVTGWLAVGVVAGVVLAWAGSALVKHSNTVAMNDNSATQMATSTMDGTSALGSTSSLVVTTPQKAGLSVAISKADVSGVTWVVVYEGQNGKPGNVLGAAIFSPDHESGTVDLLRTTLAGQTYFVTEHSDNGDRKFSLKDDPLLTENGQPTWVTFTAN